MQRGAASLSIGEEARGLTQARPQPSADGWQDYLPGISEDASGPYPTEP